MWSQIMTRQTNTFLPESCETTTATTTTTTTTTTMAAISCRSAFQSTLASLSHGSSTITIPESSIVGAQCVILCALYDKACEFCKAHTSSHWGLSYHTCLRTKYFPFAKPQHHSSVISPCHWIPATQQMDMQPTVGLQRPCEHSSAMIAFSCAHGAFGAAAYGTL
jgi:hypothetical protein